MFTADERQAVLGLRADVQASDATRVRQAVVHHSAARDAMVRRQAAAAEKAPAHVSHGPEPSCSRLVMEYIDLSSDED